MELNNLKLYQLESIDKLLDELFEEYKQVITPSHFNPEVIEQYRYKLIDNINSFRIRR